MFFFTTCSSILSFRIITSSLMRNPQRNNTLTKRKPHLMINQSKANGEGKN